MKKYNSIQLILGLLILVFIISCSNSTSPSKENESLILNDTNSVKLNSIIFNTNENIRLSYLNLVGDSRCPIGAECIWEGNARVDIAFKIENVTHLLELNTYRGFQRDSTIGKYYLKLINVEPYPNLDSSHVNKDGLVKVYISKIE